MAIERDIWMHCLAPSRSAPTISFVKSTKVFPYKYSATVLFKRPACFANAHVALFPLYPNPMRKCHHVGIWYATRPC